MRRATTAGTWLLVALALTIAGAQSRARYISYIDAKPILQMLRAALLPADLRDKSETEIQAAWPRWVSRRDTEIRARLAEGDEDSVINFLLFGVSFTAQPRITERDMDAGLSDVRDIVEHRIGDLAAAAAKPATDERLDFVRAIARRKGIDPSVPSGRDALRRYLQERLARFLAEREAVFSRAVSAAGKAITDPAAAVPEVGTLFSERGLSSDTTIYIDFGIEAALDAIKANRLLAPGVVRRVAIVGPGLDFIDKREGYDFYPPQTLQPFAVIDSLKRLGLAGPPHCGRERAGAGRRGIRAAAAARDVLSVEPAAGKVLGTVWRSDRCAGGRRRRTGGRPDARGARPAGRRPVNHAGGSQRCAAAG